MRDYFDFGYTKDANKKAMQYGNNFSNAKATQQGYNGVNKGMIGYLSDFIKNNSNNSSAILNNIMQLQNKKYEMPKFETNNALSNDWYNTALKRIQVRNQMKLDMQKQNLLSNIYNYLVQSQNNGIKTGFDYMKNINNNNAMRQGQELRYKSNMQNINEQKRYHDILNRYYNNQIRINNNKLLANESNKNNQNYYKEQELINKRLSTILKDPQSIVPNWDDLDSEQKQKAVSIYAKYGAFPKVIDNGFARGYSVEDYNDGRTDKQQNTIQGKKIIAQKTDTSGKVYVKLEDGEWYEM